MTVLLLAYIALVETVNTVLNWRKLRGIKNVQEHTKPIKSIRDSMTEVEIAAAISTARAGTPGTADETQRRRALKVDQ